MYSGECEACGTSLDGFRHRAECQNLNLCPACAGEKLRVAERAAVEYKRQRGRQLLLWLMRIALCGFAVWVVWFLAEREGREGTGIMLAFGALLFAGGGEGWKIFSLGLDFCLPGKECSDAYKIFSIFLSFQSFPIFTGLAILGAVFAAPILLFSLPAERGRRIEVSEMPKNSRRCCGTAEGMERCFLH